MRPASLICHRFHRIARVIALAAAPALAYLAPGAASGFAQTMISDAVARTVSVCGGANARNVAALCSRESQIGRRISPRSPFVPAVLHLPAHERDLTAGRGLLQLASLELYNQAWALIDAGRLDDAERLFRNVRSRIPERLRWMADDGLGWTAYYRRDYKAAQRLFENVLREVPDAYLSRKGLGFVALERKDYATAERELLASLRENPNQVPLSYTIPAERLIDAGEYGRAGSILEIGEWVYPRSADIELLMARMLIGLKQPQQAAAKANAAADLNPVSVNLKFDDLKLDPALAQGTYLSLGWGLFFAGDNQGAYRRFDQYRRSGGNDPDGLKGRGFAQFRLGRYDTAVADLQQAAEHEAGRHEAVTELVPIPGTNERAQITYNARSTMAWAYYRLGKLKEAETEFRHVLQEHPFWIDSLTGLGYTLLGAGDASGASQFFHDALRIAPSYIDAKHGLDLATVGDSGAARKPSRSVTGAVKP